MNVDWAVAIGIFLVFMSWSFTYYFGLFPGEASVSAGLESVSDRAVGLIETTELRIPVRHQAQEAGQEVLFASLDVPGGMEEGLGVLSAGGEELECMLSGGRLYWESSLDAGQNSFHIVMSDAGTGWCDSSLPTSGANQTFPLAAVPRQAVSPEALSGLEAAGYQAFRESLGLRGGIRLEWSGDEQGSIGPEPMVKRDVFARELERPLAGGGSVNLRLLLWE